MNKTKSFEISKEAFIDAYRKVKANKGSEGVDDVTLEKFEEDLERNLYKIWNRMSSGCYFPPPVKVVEIPKDNGGKRRLGIPTVSDRVAQMVVKMHLEPILESIFHKDSYGYRPEKSALGAVGTARKRCWKYNWVIDLDIKGFFDNIDHSIMVALVRRHIKEKWALLLIERWLKAPAQLENGTLIDRDKGTPQGGVISPLLANIYLHYAFDDWMKKEHPGNPFERYADDIVVHCRAKDRPRKLIEDIEKRMSKYHLLLHPEKTKIVYCKDSDRRGEYINKSFDFLGYTFRPRSAKNKYGRIFLNFLPAISEKAAKSLNRQIRSWNIRKLCPYSIMAIANMVNPVVRGWINYYGKFYGSALRRIFRQLQTALIKWIMRKFKRYRRHFLRAVRFLGRISKLYPRMFVHWEFGVVAKG